MQLPPAPRKLCDEGVGEMAILPLSPVITVAARPGQIVELMADCQKTMFNEHWEVVFELQVAILNRWVG